MLRELDKTCLSDNNFDFSSNYCWIAYHKNSPVAYACLKPLHGFNEGMGFLSRCGVLKNWRTHNLQLRLIRVRINKARKLGLGKLITYTNTWNYPSMMNLLKAKFRFYNPSTNWAGISAHYFYLNL
jgi:hypothetical protein